VRTLLILTAVDLEARGIARYLGLTSVPGASWPHFRSGPVEVACVGLRASALAARTSRFNRTSLVVSAGACGALAPALAEGALVVPTAVVTEDGRRAETAPLPGLGAKGLLLTVERVVTSGADKARLWMETGALACDMESAVIVAWAQSQGLPAAVVRGVSDTAEHGVPADLAASVGEDGRVRTVSAVRAALSRRGALKEALALRRGTNAALAAVAGALARLRAGS
jgi:adenosylhomocysteine nucleosidase